MARSCQPQAVSRSGSATAPSARGGLDQVGDAAVQRALVVRGERGQRVEVPVQVGLGEVADGAGRLLDGPGELRRPAEVDQRGEALHQRVGPGRRVGGGADDPVEERARLRGAAGLLQRPGVRRASTWSSTRSSQPTRDLPVGARPDAPARACRPATLHDYVVTHFPATPLRRDRPRRGRPPAMARAARALADGRGRGAARAEAELLAAYVLGVPRGRLALADGLAADAARPVRRAGRAGGRRAEPLQHLTGTRRLPAPGAGGRPGRLRAPAGDRAAGRLGDRAGPAPADAGGGRPVQRLRARSPSRSPRRLPAARVVRGGAVAGGAGLAAAQRGGAGRRGGPADRGGGRRRRPTPDLLAELVGPGRRAALQPAVRAGRRRRSRRRWPGTTRRRRSSAARTGWR